MKKRIIELTVKEWYEERNKKVYWILELPTGERIERLAPYGEIPWCEMKLPEDKI